METFVMRLWLPGNEEGPEALRGMLEHPATGRTVPFAGEEELLGLLRDARQARLRPNRTRERG